MPYFMCDDDTFVEAAAFYAEKLGIPDNAIIGIKLYDNLEGLQGYCEYHTDTEIPYILIGIEDSKEGDDPLAVLAHEMVHAKQYTTGELIDKGTHCMWKGKAFHDVEVDSEGYYFSPWEVEAFGKQVGLYNLYCRVG